MIFLIPLSIAALIYEILLRTQTAREQLILTLTHVIKKKLRDKDLLFRCKIYTDLFPLYPCYKIWKLSNI